MKFGILVFVVCLAGCITPQFAPSKVGQVYPVRTAPAAIELFRTQNPNKKFAEIGSVSVPCGYPVEKCVDILRQKASEKGGDAMIGLDIGATGLVMATVIRYE